MFCTVTWWEYHFLLLMFIIGMISTFYSCHRLIRWLFDHYTCDCVDSPSNIVQNPPPSYVAKPHRHEVVIINEQARPLPYED